jgi:hypothetical protein
MARTPSNKQRLVILYDANAGPTVYRIAVDIATKAWDAGSTVRVRRFGEVFARRDVASRGQWLELLTDLEDVSEVLPEDLEWASVTLVVSTPMSLQTNHSSSESAA